MADELLIKEVQKYRELYDQHHPRFKSMDRKEDIWEEISSLMGLPVDEIKLRWRNLRDSYVRSLREGAKAARRKSAHRFTEELQFLAPFIRNRLSAGNWATRGRSSGIKTSYRGGGIKASSIKCEDTTSQDLSAEEKYDELLAGNTADDDQGSDSGTIDNISTTDRVLPTAAQNSVNPDPLGPPVLPTPSLAPPLSRDEDELFLLSLVPGLKRLPPQQKSLLKIRLLQTVHEARFPSRGGSAGGAYIASVGGVDVYSNGDSGIETGFGGRCDV